MGAIATCSFRDPLDDIERPEPLIKRPLVKKLKKRGSSFAVGGEKEYSTQFPPLLYKPSGRLISGIFAFGFILVLCATVGKDFLLQYRISTAILLEYVSIPVVSVLFTYFHIWMALWLTFYPVKYVGCLQIPETNAGCGWQGIMPNKAVKMARMSVRLMTQKLISVQDIVARIDANVIVKELEPVLQDSVIEMVEEVALEAEPDLWTRVPSNVRAMITKRAKADAPIVINGFVEDIKNNIETVLNLEELVVQAFVEEPNLLNHMFISCGFSELAFIRDCGAYMGGAFGVVQVICWYFYSEGWMLPTFGFVAGLFTNWFALKMIFEPVEPVHCCGFKFHGLFLQRQQAVAEVYAQIVADNILYARNILREIIRGRLSDELLNILFKHVVASTERIYPKTVKIFKSDEALINCKVMATQKILERMPQTTRHVEKYLDSAMALEVIICDKLSKIPSTEFEKLLHPVFQEDEWKLILMGGVLGIIIGCMQWKALGA